MDADDAAAVGLALAEKVRRVELPPDDAYWWTRIVCEAYRAERQRAEVPATFVNHPVLKVLP